MKIKRGAWVAFYSGISACNLMITAKDKRELFLYWLVAAFGVAYVFSWEWATGFAILAVISGKQWFDAVTLAPEVEALEGILGVSRG